MEQELLTREEAAILLGVSVHEVRRRQTAGQLGIVRGKRGQAFVRRDAIDAFLAKKETKLAEIAARAEKVRQKKESTLASLRAQQAERLRRTPPNSLSPEQAASVFSALREGVSAVECVIRFNVTPEIMTYLIESYAMLSNLVLVSGEVVKEVNRLPLDGPMPITKGEDFLAVLKGYADEALCLECNKRPKQLCKACVTAAIRKHLSAKEGL